MPTTIRYTIGTASLDPEVVIAVLGDLGFSAFEEHEDATSLLAYLPPGDAPTNSEQDLGAASKSYGFIVSELEVLADINYNAQWESDYAPVEVEGFLRIRAPFHTPSDAFEHEMVVVPEMSFGTGHHATTYLMATLLRDYAPFGKTCFDFGTGTGVLALLAMQLGAARVVATDIDQRCVESTLANAARNAITLEEVRLGDEQSLPDGPFDVILANINRAVLLNTLPALAQRLSPGGEVWVSGILHTDLDVIDSAALVGALTRVEKRQRGEWLACRYAVNSNL